MKLYPINSSLDDLVPLSIVTVVHPPPLYRAYRVLAPVLSDLGIVPGQIVLMRLLPEGESVEAYAIVAVRFEGKLLLRQFVPPRMLTSNSITRVEPMLVFREGINIEAYLSRYEIDK